MKQMPYNEARVLVGRGDLTEDAFDQMRKAGLIAPSAIEKAAERVPEKFRKPYTEILESVEDLNEALPDGLYIRVQLARKRG